MEFLKKNFRPNRHIEIFNKNIFSFLEATEKRFNIYDIDLMICLKEPIIERMAKCIEKTMDEKAIVNITSCIGRKITEKEYNDLMPQKLLDNLNCKILFKYSGGYCDRVIPMRFFLMAIEK